MAGSFLNQRKNKRFNYTPRYSKTGVDKESLTKKDEFISKWEKARDANRHKKRTRVSMRFLILVLVLLLISMYLLDKKFR